MKNNNKKNERVFYANRKIFEATNVSANGKLVYLYLNKCADLMGKCWPAHKTIAAACNLSVTAVKAALVDLKQAGWVIIAPRYREEGGKSSNFYMVLGREKGKMFPVDVKVWDLPISSKAKLVQLFLCRCADDKGTCWPAHKTIAAACGCGVSTIRKALALLKEAAEIVIKVRKRENNGQSSNLYSLLPTTVKKAQEVAKRGFCNVAEKAQEVAKSFCNGRSSRSDSQIITGGIAI